MKQRSVLKTVIKTVVAILILLLIFVGGAVAYVYFTAKSSDEQNPPQSEAEKISLPEPSKPNPDNPVGASVVSITTPVKLGANSSVTVRTTATATCTIKVVHGEPDDEIAVKDSGLAAKVADQFGNVTWSWTMEETAPVGKWTAKVTCKYGKKSGYVEGYFQVKK